MRPSIGSTRPHNSVGFVPARSGQGSGSSIRTGSGCTSATRIATRRNDRTIETDRHEMVRNRDLWTVTAINDDWTITARGAKDVTLPTANPRDHVELAYAIKGLYAANAGWRPLILRVGVVAH
jgi:hypothetical protein